MSTKFIKIRVFSAYGNDETLFRRDLDQAIERHNEANPQAKLGAKYNVRRTFFEDIGGFIAEVPEAA